MESVKTGKTNKVGKNTEMANTKANKEVGFLQKLQRKLEDL
ncbi:DUF874 family protein [Helicobacter pylori]